MVDVNLNKEDNSVPLSGDKDIVPEDVQYTNPILNNIMSCFMILLLIVFFVVLVLGMKWDLRHIFS